MGCSTVDRAIQYIIINYRWVFVCVFLLPASVLYEIYNYGRNWIVVKLNSAPKQHDRKVKNVQRQVSKISVLCIKVNVIAPCHYSTFYASHATSNGREGYLAACLRF
jgi:predicted PilT family ATPase